MHAESRCAVVRLGSRAGQGDPASVRSRLCRLSAKCTSAYGGAQACVRNLCAWRHVIERAMSYQKMCNLTGGSFAVAELHDLVELAANADPQLPVADSCRQSVLE